jgi:hypothetical protein
VSEDTAVIPEVNIDVAQEAKKPRLEALLFCDYVAITTEQKAVLGGVFDKFYIQPENRMVALFLYVRTSETRGPVQLNVFGPDNKLGMTGTLNHSGELPEEGDKLLHVQIAMDMRFEAKMEGLYWFEILYNGQSLGGNCFRVIMRKEGE